MKTSKAALLWVCLFVLLNVTAAIGQRELIINKIVNTLDHWNSQDSLLKHSQLSFSLHKAGDSKALVSYHAGKCMVPASNLKLFTTAAAFEVLGEEFRFSTKLEYQGNIDDQGILLGDLYLTGSGDPSLGSERFKDFPSFETLMSDIVNQVKVTGIKGIHGNIVADGKIFDYAATSGHWMWGDIGNYYGAFAAGLNLNENMYRLFFKPGMAVGDTAALLTIAPSIPNIEFRNMVLTGPSGSGDMASIYGGPYSNFRYVTGTIPLGTDQFQIKGSIPDPLLIASYAMTALLKQEGIEITGKPSQIYTAEKGVEAQPRMLIKEYLSPPLKDLIRETNRQSLNLYAESIYKTTALVLSKSSIYDSAGKTMQKWWRLQGMNVAGMRLNDGCGLALSNTITATQMTYLLNSIKGKSYFEHFYKSLPVAGISGTLARIGKGTKAEGKIRAKTGTQTRTSCYSGYVDTGKSGLLAFSLMINSYDGTSAALAAKVEKLFILMAGL